MTLQDELDALTQNLLADTSVEYVTQSQVGGLNGLITMGLTDKSSNMRHAILKLWAGKAMRAIAGVDVTSAKNLTAPVATFLINQLLEPDSSPWRLSNAGRDFIRQSETYIKEQNLL